MTLADDEDKQRDFTRKPAGMSVPFIRAEYLFGFGTEQQKFDCKPAFERIKPLKSEFWKKGLIIACGLNLLALIASVFTYPEISADSRAKRAISRQVSRELQ